MRLLSGKIKFMVFWLVSPIALFGQGASIIFENPPSLSSPHSIESYTFFYDDTSKVGLDLEEIKKKQFKPLVQRANDRISGLDEARSVTWLHFSIENRLADTLSLLYNCNMHYAIEIHEENLLLKQYGLFDVGAARTLPLLKIPPGQRRYYWVKITNYFQSVLPIVSTLLTRQSQLEGESKEISRSMPLLVFCSSVLGCFFFMLVFAFYNYYLNRDTAFLYYGLSVLTLFHGSLMLMSNRFGVLAWTNHSLIFTYFILYILFVDRMVEIRKQSRTGWRLALLLILILTFNQLLSLSESLIIKAPVFGNNLFYKLELVPGMILVILGVWYVVKSKSPLRKYLIAGMLSMVILGFMPLWLNLYFPMEMNAWEAFINFPPAWLALGLVIENICFAMALAYRMHLSEKEKIALSETYATRLSGELALRVKEIEEQSRELEDQKIKQLTSEFEQRLKATEMSALRAQMNPHFIFNCLNSIKLYTLENNSGMAAEYLTRFSRLIRLVLENSQHELVTLSSELETLRLYVDMETMRFKRKFNYIQSVDERIDQEYIEIPSMLIQPYIENAIWHGLMHKEEEGNLVVNITQPDDDLIRIEVIDDGVGRERAKEYQSKSATKHKSAGLKMTSERIALINQRSTHQTVVQIEDLVDPEGFAAGTKVTLTIPL